MSWLVCLSTCWKFGLWHANNLCINLKIGLSMHLFSIFSFPPQVETCYSAQRWFNNHLYLDRSWPFKAWEWLLFPFLLLIVSMVIRGQCSCICVLGNYLFPLLYQTQTKSKYLNHTASTLWVCVTMHVFASLIMCLQTALLEDWDCFWLSNKFEYLCLMLMNLITLAFMNIPL